MVAAVATAAAGSGIGQISGDIVAAATRTQEVAAGAAAAAAPAATVGAGFGEVAGDLVAGHGAVAVIAAGSGTSQVSFDTVTAAAGAGKKRRGGRRGRQQTHDETLGRGGDTRLGRLSGGISNRSRCRATWQVI